MDEVLWSIRLGYHDTCALVHMVSWYHASMIESNIFIIVNKMY